MSIESWRAEIDDLDRHLVVLLNRRARLAIEIGRLKAATGLAAQDATREAAILSQARSANEGPLTGPAVERIFGLILRESRRAARTTVAATERGGR
ncbi:MAG TPA: chorismate mutase [Thermoanaerobaculia bacterium]